MKFLYRTKQIILLIGDILSFFIAFWLSLFLRNLELPSGEIFRTHLPLFVTVFIIWIINNYINNLYDFVTIAQKQKFFRRFAETGAISLMIGIIFFYLINNSGIAPKTILLFNVVLGYGISFLWRLLFRIISGAKKLQTNIIFVGFIEELREIISILDKRPENGYKIVAIIDPEYKIKSSDFNFDVYHNLQSLRPAITNHKAQLVIIAPHLQTNQTALNELYELLFWKIQINDLSSFYELITGRVPPFTFSEGWFLQHLRNKEQSIYDKIKTVIGFVSGIIIFIIFILLLPPIGILIKLTSKGPLFIKQKRVGQYGKIFMMYKFRSMFALAADGSAEVNGADFAKINDSRKTSIGKILRKIRLDELPQAINLLKGDITLVGPRPERPEITEKLESQISYYPLRHIVKPGLTGWAVINQNYTDNMETSLQKLQYDLFYIKNKSLLLDISIILKTINLLIRFMGQ